MGYSREMNRLVVTPIILGLLPGCLYCPDEEAERSIPLSAEEVEAALEDGVVDEAECLVLCGEHTNLREVDECSFEILDRSTEEGVGFMLHCGGTYQPMCKGRRPVGLVPGARPAQATLGAWAADACTMEAASVVAFRRLAGDLRRLGAPEELVQQSRRAATDEVRHARAMRRIARSHGVEPRRPRVREPKPPTRARLARQNLVAGCLEETWAALVACHQAQHSTDPAVRRAMQAIAVDELRHAELAWAIHAWAGRDLHSAWDRAVARQRAGACRPTSPALARTLGLPTGERALRLYDGLMDGVRGRA